MTGDRTNLLDMQRDAIASGDLSERQIRGDVKEKLGQTIAILRWGPDDRKEKIVSQHHGKIAFADWGGDFVPEDGDVWACAVKEEKYNAVIVNPLLKITPAMLLRVNDDIRKGITAELWAQNKAAYEKDFEALYKEGIYMEVREALEKEYRQKLDEKDAKIDDLNGQIDFLNAALKVKEAGEHLGDHGALGRGAPPRAVPPPADRTVASALPGAGIGDADCEVLEGAEFHVLCRSGALWSESFVTGRYFVHMTPNREFVVIRPHSSGDAMCINRSLNPKALEEICLKYEGRELMCEYSARYRGLVVYLNRPLNKKKETESRADVRPSERLPATVCPVVDEAERMRILARRQRGHRNRRSMGVRRKRGLRAAEAITARPIPTAREFVSAPLFTSSLFGRAMYLSYRRRGRVSFRPIRIHRGKHATPSVRGLSSRSPLPVFEKPAKHIAAFW